MSEPAVQTSALDLLHGHAMSMMVGATVALSEGWDEIFDGSGIGPRDPGRNTFVGFTFTLPEPSAYVLGATWEDAKHGQDDEDVYVIDPATGKVAPYYRGRWESVDARYSGTHHGDKSYLRQTKAPGS